MVRGKKEILVTNFADVVHVQKEQKFCIHIANPHTW